MAMPDDTRVHKPAAKGAGKGAIVVRLDQAARDLQRQKRRRPDPPASEARDGKHAGKWTPDRDGWPTEDPGALLILGIEGGVVHLIDSDGQLRSIEESAFTHAGIQGLFKATPNWVEWFHPRYGRARKAADDEAPPPPPIESFKDDAVRKAIFFKASRKGPFALRDKLRGLGMWKLDGEVVIGDPKKPEWIVPPGALVYHAGEELWAYHHAKGRPVPLATGLCDRKVYPRFPELPAPYSGEIVAADNPSGVLLETLRKWNWRRGDVDPVLMLGFAGVAYLGGALDWRSAVLLLGDRSTGKTSLQQGMKALFGDAIFGTSDTTAAGIYQVMSHDTRAVAVDELEPDADPRKVNDLVKLMRIASSGALGSRGGQSGQPTSFQLRCAFLFSAINNPLHEAQDLSRIAILRLQPFGAAQTKAPALSVESTGPRLLHLLMREWPRFEATLELYREALVKGGHDKRGQDTYGTLIACADLLLGADLAEALDVPLAWTFGDDGERLRNEAGIEWWAEHLGVDMLPEIEDALPNWRECFETVLEADVPAWHGGRKGSIGTVLDGLKAGAITIEDARRDLQDAGLGILIQGAIEGVPMVEGYILAIPNASERAAQLFKSKPKFAMNWKDALRSCPIDGVMITDKAHNRVRINGFEKRCTLVVMGRYAKATER